MTGISGLIAHRPTCIALFSAGAAHIALTAAGLPGWQCPFRGITGLPCPGCGLTRACLLLLSGHFREAIAIHAFAPVAVASVVLIGAGAILPLRHRDEMVRFLRRLDAVPHITASALAALLIYWSSRLILDGRP